MKQRDMRGLVLVGAFALLAACRTVAPAPEGACQIVSGLPGPEDFDLDADWGEHGRLIVSLQERRLRQDGGQRPPGALAWVPLKTGGRLGEARRFVVENRDDLAFHPHGISLARQPAGDLRLYVINHLAEDRHPIEIYELRADRLVFRQRLESPLLTSPNDLIALADDELYVSIDRSHRGPLSYLEGAVSWPGGKLLHHRAGRWRVAIEGVAYANGVAVNGAGDRLYLAAVREEGVREIARDPSTGALGETLRFLAVGSGVDNLMWERPGVLNVAAHPDVLAFVRHVSSADSHSPSEVYRIDLATGGVTRIFTDDGSSVDAASTARVVRGRVLLGQVYDPELASCALQ